MTVDECLGHLPSGPAVALTLGMAYLRLGGTLSIASNGNRYFGRPEPCLFRIEGKELPQLAGARPALQFHSADEWHGAIKMVEALLNLLDRTDSGLVFDALASAAVDERKFVPSIDEPKRRLP